MTVISWKSIKIKIKLSLLKAKRFTKTSMLKKHDQQIVFVKYFDSVK